MREACWKRACVKDLWVDEALAVMRAKSLAKPCWGRAASEQAMRYEGGTGAGEGSGFDRSGRRGNNGFCR